MSASYRLQVSDPQLRIAVAFGNKLNIQDIGKGVQPMQVPRASHGHVILGSETQPRGGEKPALCRTVPVKALEEASITLPPVLPPAC